LLPTFQFLTDIGEDEIGIQISAPPIDGKANEELIDYLSSVNQIFRFRHLISITGFEREIKRIDTRQRIKRPIKDY
jgi:uncharacterized protein YggU (UPF0235/DUF167 family)